MSALYAFPALIGGFVAIAVLYRAINRKTAQQTVFLAGDGSYAMMAEGTDEHYEALWAACSGRAHMGSDCECSVVLVPDSADSAKVLAQVNGERAGHLPAALAAAFRTMVATLQLTGKTVECDGLLVDATQSEMDPKIGLKLDLVTPMRPAA